MSDHKIVSHEEWTTTRAAFLAKEKEFTRLREELARERRELPWELVNKQYAFQSERGRETLADLFDGRTQLIVWTTNSLPPQAPRACRSYSANTTTSFSFITWAGPARPARCGRMVTTASTNM